MAYTSQLPNKVWRGNRVATVAISLILSSLLMSTFVFKFYIKMTWESAFFIIAIQFAMNIVIILLSSQVIYYLNELVGKYYMIYIHMAYIFFIIYYMIL